jgi:hypothetical protein
MNLSFFVSSAINLDSSTENTKFLYANKRTAFTSEERFRQTQFTINSIKLLFPEAKIYVLDISENGLEYKNRLGYVSNLVFLPLEEINKAIAYTCRNHQSKGYCEALSTQALLNNCFDDIKKSDYFIKISGRYFITEFDKSVLTDENKDKYLFTFLRNFDWNPKWGYPDHLNKNGKLGWAFTCLYAIGNSILEEFNHNFQQVPQYFIDNHHVANIMDYECVVYDKILRDKTNIIHPNWHVAGWSGAEGNFGVM